MNVPQLPSRLLHLALLLAFSTLIGTRAPPAAAQPVDSQPSISAQAPATRVPGAAPTAASPSGSFGGLVAPGDAPLEGLLPHDLSPWAMFLHADIIVQAVMIGLAFASLVTWVVWLAKTMHLLGARHRLVRSIRSLTAVEGLADLPADGASAFRSGPVLALVRAARHEVERSIDLSVDGTKERVAIALGRIEANASRAMTRGTGLIATIGSTAPFVGLFGTVWGIMNAFVGISRAHTTNLAVVAPGIAEALLATAIGLVAAIPAVVIYNGFARGTSGYRALLADASAEVLRHLSRDLDRRRMFPAE